MGIINAVKKIARTRVVEKIEDEFAKKQNQEKAYRYCVYINNNITRIRKLMAELSSETQLLITKLSSMKRFRLFPKSKNKIRDTQGKVITNLMYLYLSRDFFNILSKSVSGVMLSNKELLLVIKFAPYFDGTPVLYLTDENNDDSLLGAFKEIGQELKSSFITTERSSTGFHFEEYLYRYKEQFENYIIPDIDSAIENFENAMSTKGKYFSSFKSSITDIFSANEIECSNCHTKVKTNSKFCPECGNKMEIKKTLLCKKCSKPINLGAKFCANCGSKI